jgi:chemotaxis protein CheD
MPNYPSTPAHCFDVFLNPGEFYFGGQDTRIRTLLGSCVAITLWHPRLKLGGMCHYLLPSCHNCAKKPVADGRYADNAMVLFMQELDKIGSKPADYEVKMFGGGDQFPAQSQGHYTSLPCKNILSGRNLLKQHGFVIKAEHLGGTGHRNVIFDVWSGEVWLQHVAQSQEIV